jgi:lactate dehydrogenase-like 2-hydroxyacid dehydrogenase
MSGKIAAMASDVFVKEPISDNPWRAAQLLLLAPI